VYNEMRFGLGRKGYACIAGDVDRRLSVLIIFLLFEALTGYYLK